MGRSLLTAVVLLVVTLPVSGQPVAPEIRVVGEHAPIRGDTQELARQLAVVNGQTKAWQAASAQLRTRPDVQALRLTTSQLEAFTAVIVDTDELPPTAPPKAGEALQVPLRALFSAGDAVRRLAGLKADPDVATSIVAAWTEMQALHARLQAQTKQRASATDAEVARVAQEQEQTLRALTVRHLTARAAAALARIEPATVGGRVASDAGVDLAGTLAEQARALSSDSPHVQSLTADLLLVLEQPEAAEDWYRKALVGNQNPSMGHLKLAEVLRLQGKLDEAITELLEALRLDATSAAAHTDLGLILRQQGKVDESMAEYREAIRLDPDWADAHNGLAVALAGEGRMEQAADEFREIVRIDPESTIGYYNLATALANLDRDVESAAALREVVRIYPNHYNAHFNLGELFRLEGKYDESAKQFREYVRLAPDTPQNQRNLKRARSYIQQFEN